MATPNYASAIQPARNDDIEVHSHTQECVIHTIRGNEAHTKPLMNIVGWAARPSPRLVQKKSLQSLNTNRLAIVIADPINQLIVRIKTNFGG
jgi:hypothetical protein